MFFGLSNVPASFQGYVNKIVAEKLDVFFIVYFDVFFIVYLDVFVIVYLDDILIYTKDAGQSHVETVWWVLREFRKYCLFANLKKYCFY